MKIIQSFDQVIPEYSLPYLINNDDSNLSEKDKLDIDTWFNKFHTSYLANYVNIGIDLDCQPFFAHCNDINKLGATCVFAIIQILE